MRGPLGRPVTATWAEGVLVTVDPLHEQEGGLEGEQVAVDQHVGDDGSCSASGSGTPSGNPTRMVRMMFMPASG